VPPPTCAAKFVGRPSSFSASAAGRPTKIPVWVGWGASAALAPAISACGAGASSTVAVVGVGRRTAARPAASAVVVAVDLRVAALFVGRPARTPPRRLRSVLLHRCQWTPPSPLRHSAANSRRGGRGGCHRRRPLTSPRAATSRRRLAADAAPGGRGGRHRRRRQRGSDGRRRGGACSGRRWRGGDELWEGVEDQRRRQRGDDGRRQRGDGDLQLQRGDDGRRRRCDDDCIRLRDLVPRDALPTRCLIGHISLHKKNNTHDLYSGRPAPSSSCTNRPRLSASASSPAHEPTRICCGGVAPPSADYRRCKSAVVLLPPTM